MSTKTKTAAKKPEVKPVVVPAAAPAKRTRAGGAKLISTTPNKLASAIGGDTAVLVSIKSINDILSAKAKTNLIAEAGL